MKTKGILKKLILVFAVFFLFCGCSVKKEELDENLDQNTANLPPSETLKQQKSKERRATEQSAKQNETLNEPKDEKMPEETENNSPEEKMNEEEKAAITEKIITPFIYSNPFFSQAPNEIYNSIPKEPEIDERLEKLWLGVDDVASAAQLYYTENFSKTRLISKNGFFYNKAAESTVDVNYLCNMGYLDQKYAGYDYKILLLYGSDVAKYEELSIKDSDKDLAVFVAFKESEADKYLIASNKSTGGILDGWKYRNLLKIYSQNHGSINQLFPKTPEYERILTFIKMYESKFDNYYVRSLFADDKYAIVTVSSQWNTADVKQYILLKENDLWEVVMDRLEEEPRLVVAVNKKLPDFNIQMLPNYSLYDYKNRMKSDFTDITSLMIEKGHISSLGDLAFMAGVKDEYCYVITLDNNRYLFQYKDGSWKIENVKSAFEAKNMMLEQDKQAPVFLLLDE